MTLPSPVFIGYFPKVTRRNPEWLNRPTVTELCSVSTCFSDGPDDWIQHWKHNDLGFYDSENLAVEVVGETPERFDLYAYRVFPFRCLGDTVEDVVIGPDLGSVPEGYEFLGHDIVTKSVSDFFECSPLSCNLAARDYKVNEHCLISDPAPAYRALIEISRAGNYEPGPYYLFEVYRRIKKDEKMGS